MANPKRWYAGSATAKKQALKTMKQDWARMDAAAEKVAALDKEREALKKRLADIQKKLNAAQSELAKANAANRKHAADRKRDGTMPTIDEIHAAYKKG